LDRWEWENVMGVNMGAVVGSAAVCGVLLLAGCGSGTEASAPTVAAAADAEWNPPRPTGVPDEEWATVVDPASLPLEDLDGGFCQAVKPTPAEVEANVTQYPGTTVEELNAYYDYVIAYVAPLCAVLPPTTDPKGASVGRKTEMGLSIG